MVPTPAKGTSQHTVVPAGYQTAWTPGARSLASVPARQVPGPQEPRLPPALPQNVILPWWRLAPLQPLLGLDPVGSSGLRSGRPVAVPPCLRCRRRVCSAHSPRCVCGGPRWRWARHGHSEHRGCSLLAALGRPGRVPVPAGCARVLPSPSAHRLQLTQKPPEHPPSLAVSPATVSPSFPHSGFAQRCHILPHSMSPYPFSQEELPWSASPLLPRAQHPRPGTDALQGLPPPHRGPAECRQGWGHSGVPTNIPVHTGHPQEAGGCPGPWPRWAAGRGRTQPRGDLWGDPAVLRWLFWAWLLCIGLWPV